VRNRNSCTGAHGDDRGKCACAYHTGRNPKLAESDISLYDPGQQGTAHQHGKQPNKVAEYKVEVNQVEMTAFKKVLSYPTPVTIDKDDSAHGYERGHKDFFSLISKYFIEPFIVTRKPVIYNYDLLAEHFTQEKKRKADGYDRAHPCM
jgi:hypothetical protein